MKNIAFIGRFLLSIALCAINTSSPAQIVTYFHNDLSGTPMVATDSSGNVLWKEAYKPYGEKAIRSHPANSNKIGFQGQPYDNESGLSYMGARYYDPALGRFMGVDPKAADPGDLHSINRYAFANNNPYKYVDPDGHSPLDVAFLAYDVGKLGVAMYTGVGAGAAAADVGLSLVGLISPVPGVGQALKAGRSVERAVSVSKGVKDAAKALPDNALVVRGGLNTAEQFATASGVKALADGKVGGISVNSAPGKTVKELSEKIPNGKVGVSTVGDIRKAGGSVRPDPNPWNPDHCECSGLTPAQLEKLFQPVIPNPAK